MTTKQIIELCMDTNNRKVDEMDNRTVDGYG